MRYISLYKFVKAVDSLEKEDQKITYYNLKKKNTSLSNRLIIDCFKLTTALHFLSMHTYWRDHAISSYDKITIYQKTDTWRNLQKFIFKEIDGDNKNGN